jgi:hypothetical protein
MQQSFLYFILLILYITFYNDSLHCPFQLNLSTEMKFFHRIALFFIEANYFFDLNYESNSLQTLNFPVSLLKHPKITIYYSYSKNR